jgi:hypothetical protein
MTITAEQARALLAGITPGPWEIGARRYDDDGSAVVFIDGNGWLQFCQIVIRLEGALKDDPCGHSNADAISAVPDMLDTIIAQSARIEALEAWIAAEAEDRGEDAS